MIVDYEKPKLEYCPFCGGYPDLRFDEKHYSYWIECDRCGARGPKSCSADFYEERRLEAVIEAVNNWNARNEPNRIKKLGLRADREENENVLCKEENL